MKNRYLHYNRSTARSCTAQVCIHSRCFWEKKNSQEKMIFFNSIFFAKFVRRNSKKIQNFFFQKILRIFWNMQEIAGYGSVEFFSAYLRFEWFKKKNLPKNNISIEFKKKMQKIICQKINKTLALFSLNDSRRK